MILQFISSNFMEQSKTQEKNLRQKARRKPQKAEK